MELALYCPDCGYYEKEDDKIGRGGDFYTSVSVGGLFGELLAFQFSEWLEQLPAGPLQLIEAGAHDGRLAADVLRWIQRRRPKLLERVEYTICESSDKRRGWQRETLKEFADHVRWRDSDLGKEAGRIAGIVFSNELLDAMPVHRLGWSASRREWFEWGVVLAGDSLDWSRMQESDVLSPGSPVYRRFADLPGKLLDILPDDFTTEVCPAAENWWRNAAAAVQHGLLLTLDYGLSTEEFFAPQRSAGTLRAYHRHRLCEDLVAKPGEQDLTAHVNFSVIQKAGESAGLRTHLFTSQSDFLTGIMKRYWPEADGRGDWSAERSREFQTLIHPEHLGRAFRVLVQAR